MAGEKDGQMSKVDRPEYCTDDHLAFLDAIRESSITNMFGAIPHLQRHFPELRRQKGKGFYRGK